MTAQVVLVGPPGAGKTTVGQVLAARLAVGFRDTDADVEAVAGKPVAEIFFDDGEQAFRRLEQAAVAAALAEHDGVIALGGGAVLAAETRALLTEEDPLRASRRQVVYLTVGLADAAVRVGLARDRPVLAINPRATLHRLLAERHPIYESVAVVTVGTDGRTPEAVAEAVLSALAVPR